jgi:hypothetical protein
MQTSVWGLSSDGSMLSDSVMSLYNRWYKNITLSDEVMLLAYVNVLYDNMLIDNMMYVIHVIMLLDNLLADNKMLAENILSDMFNSSYTTNILIMISQYMIKYFFLYSQTIL